MTEKAGADASTGVAGLDDILAGAARERVYLLEGSPGTGKTTSAMSFLRAGAALGEKTLYITLSETEEELRDTAQSHGWDLKGIDIFELVPPKVCLTNSNNKAFSILRPGAGRDHPDDFRGGALEPRRVVIDSLSELRLLAQKLASVSPAGAGPEALFRQTRRHRPAVGRSDHRNPGQTGAQRGPRGDPAGRATPEYGAERRRVRVINTAVAGFAAASTTSPFAPAG